MTKGQIMKRALNNTADLVLLGLYAGWYFLTLKFVRDNRNDY